MTRAAFRRQTSVMAGCVAAIVLVITGCGTKSGHSQSTPASTTATGTTSTSTSPSAGAGSTRPSTGTTTSKAGGNLSGEWESSDYECPAGIKHTERLQITQIETHISATKTLGDDCVPTGHESFSGTVGLTSGGVRLWVGTPGGQPSLGPNANLKVLDANTFELICPASVFNAGCAYKFTRASNPN